MIIDTLKELVSKLNIEINVLSATFENGFTTFKVCCTYHARHCSNIYIDNVKVSVDSIVFGDSIKVKGDYSTATKISLEAPTFFHGTVINTGTEVMKIRDSHDKFPMIYLFEPIVYDYQDEFSPIEFEAELRLFFLDITNFKDWCNEEHYSFAIKPMRTLVDRFVKQLRKDRRNFGDIGNYKVIDHAKIGVDIGSTNDKLGFIKSIFSDFNSGVEVIINIPFKKQNKCEPCKC